MTSDRKFVEEVKIERRFVGRAHRGANSFGHRIREYRVLEGLTLSELASRVGVTKSYIWEIENGRVSPSAETVWRMAVVLDVTMEELMDG